ncbi:transcriptional regulator with XRE-family HTH domain [Silvibacterium bohemicum]|uniref:Transcriptional regulator with XRE-family HTH domain n=2 Tax=Silvibacterium bohemicum TaxID=1577686 RepID=A0A841JZL4_9BACT|nr:transcriptional regulator with XRE-family HTH domain [Silvibacterium bohemicum]
MKQATFADAIGLTLKQAGEIERGNSFPKPEKLEIIAKALNVPLKELFDFGKTRYFPPPPVMPSTEARRTPKNRTRARAAAE